MGNRHIMTSKTLISSIITVTLGLLFLTSSYAGVYKWVDESGQVHYGERPSGAGAERMTIRTNETTKPRQLQTLDNEADNETDKQLTSSPDGSTADAEKAEETLKKPDKPEKPKISPQEKRRLCNEAKSDIAAITSRGRMREITKKGEYIYLTEKQRQQRLSAARKKQREYCR